MPKTTANFLSAQLDFIFFFYGLSFILLGVVCLTIRRQGGGERPWGVLAAFGFLHGAQEWLDMTALALGDSVAFKTARVAVLILSFLALAEFGRLEAARLGPRAPGRWVYAPLLVVILGGIVICGPAAANALSRYLLGLPGALLAAWIFSRRTAAGTPAAGRDSIQTALGFALYALAAGVVAPVAPFWPSSVMNQATFFAATGVPVQLVRGMLAVWLSLSIWTVWGRLIVREVDSAVYAAFLRRQFAGAVAALSAILIGGWMLTQYLGTINEGDLKATAQGDMDLLASRLAGESSVADAMAQALARSPSVRLYLKAGGGAAVEARSTLAVDVEVSGASEGLIVGPTGVVMAMDAAGSGGRIDRAWLKAAMSGGAAGHYALDRRSGEALYFASYPIREAGGRLAGAAVLTRPLARLQSDLRRFDAPYFLVDRSGVVRMTNQTDWMSRSLWPTAGGKTPFFDKAVADMSWVDDNGSRAFVRRRAAGPDGWSLVLVTPTTGIFASRVLGIVITLLVTLAKLLYVFGRERIVRDGVQSKRRLQLQEIASDFRLKASQDALTGLANRLAFDQGMAEELARTQRYGAPLSLIMFDIDHFKRINDRYGHPAGDKVLRSLSRLVADEVRINDLVARWGGEEFVVLVPGVDGSMACALAEKLRASIAGFVFEEVGMATCSFGVAEFAEGDDALTLIARADAALYAAKQGGRNAVRLAAATPGRVASAA
jgi:diguanylate cyclase (GGDEF)-like protein